MPADEVACRKDLTALGAEFSDAPAQFSAEGCSLPYPVILKDVGAGISLTPPAVLDCAMAEAVIRFATGPMETRLKATYGQGLKSISQASAYVCRPRAGTLRLSEHAFGNALDIGALVLQDGTVLSVGSALPDKETVVLQQIRNDACGPFKTVLGPGSDPDHASHLHLDLAPRRHGGLYCQ